MTNPDEEEYSGFKTLGTDIDEAYMMLGDDTDVDDVEFDDYSDE
jgi:hypothetical protein